ncbi:DUF418 family protein [Pantoea sp. Acro-805]|uniref:DUF418 family protein n=1 Tax=Candidatus Pantoea formicae TaxID=2608355 RepID=A0ABX0R3S1_9GAMM|nr:DUF418 domain-containing protein YeiB [Pantoea formicae]MDF7651727.1 DUF418 domain-containing protein YeiB [Erwiniaceae bacterium L1_54_3]NIF01792.1 DUF418 family protein [Pantoea formicae]
MQRYLALDFIRGCAILGILLLNIVGFGLPSAAYLNPAWQGTISLSDAWTWAIMDGLAQLKFLTLFALLFGAGLYLQTPRGSRWLSARLTLLVLLGFIHAVFFWEGDILLDYGLIGLIIWRMLREVPSDKALLQTGVLLYLIGCGVLLVFWGISSSEPGRSWLPGAADIEYESYWKLVGGWEAVQNRLDHLSSGLMALAAQYGWQLAGLMLIGAALMRSGWLKGEFSVQHYRRSAALLLTIGWLMAIPGIAAQWLVGWEFRWSGFLLQLPRDLASPFISLGYAALCFGFWPQIGATRFSHAIQCVGRMALSNYLLQTLICTTLFYRFNLFLKFDRLHLLALVPAVWLVNILFSVLWLHYFPQGPMEWIWRKLTRLAAGKPDSSPRIR